MEQKEQEVYEAMPIPYGEWKLLGTLMVACVFGSLSVRGFIVTPFGMGWFVKLAFSFALLSFLVFLVWRSVVDWLKNYWANNVIGHKLFVWLGDDGKADFGIADIDQVSYGNVKGKYLDIPLGGWNSCPPVLREDGVKIDSYFYFRFTTSNGKVWIVDMWGSSVGFHFTNMSFFLDYYSRFSDISSWDVWLAKMKGMEDYHRDLLQTTKLDALRDKVMIKAGFILRIVATRRFIKSKEAEKIKDDYVADLKGLLSLLPANDNLRERYAELVS